MVELKSNCYGWDGASVHASGSGSRKEPLGLDILSPAAPISQR
jgi:hypothetical protein